MHVWQASNSVYMSMLLPMSLPRPTFGIGKSRKRFSASEKRC